MTPPLPTPGPRNVGWVIEDYDELSSDLSIFIEVETTREEGPPSDPRVPLTYGPSRTIVRRSSYYGMIDEIELDGPITYHHVQHPSGAITLLIGSVGGKPWIIARMLDTRGLDLTNTTPSRSKDMTEYVDETEYTDEELALAIHAATYVRSGSISISHDISQASRQIHTSLLSDLRAILKHLPAQQGDWQECGFNDLRPTDKRVKAVFIGGSVIEGTPDQSSSESIFLIDGPVIHTYDEATFYRIPAPVQHPDPEVDKYILVHKADPKYNRHMFPNVGMSNGISGYDVSNIHIPSEHILEWEELTPKVVADND